MDRITSISAFVQVAESGSFSGAARRLNITPAMVTNHVQFLEGRLGVRLLNRTTRKVGLTEAGTRYYQRCTRILSDLAEADSFARSLRAAPHGTFRLNTDVALARLLGPVIADYVAVYPAVSFELIMTDQSVDMVEERFDLAVRAGDLPDRNSLIQRRLGIGKSAICAAPAYLTRAGVPRHPKDLAGHNCLDVVPSPAGAEWRFAGPDGEYLVEVGGNLRSNSLEALRAAAVAGHGVCVLPLTIVADDLRAGRLERLLPEYRTPDAIIHAVYPAGPHVSVNLRTFLDFLLERLRAAERDRPKEPSAGDNFSASVTAHPARQN
jgi:DNA-binding transcriptional LysR family regulator